MNDQEIEQLYTRVTTIPVPNCYGNLKPKCECPLYKECLQKTASRNAKRGD